MPKQRIAYQDHTDEALMQLVLEGNRDAFGVVYDRYADRLMRYFYRLLWQDQELAGDMVQDLFAKIIHKPELYDPSRPLKTWIFSVASNMVKNQYKRAEVRGAAAGELRFTEPTATDGEEITDQMELAAFTAALELALNGLEPHHRDTFVLRYKEGLSLKEVGEALECSEGTVKSRLFYAVRKLAGKLQQYNTKAQREGSGALLTPKH